MKRVTLRDIFRGGGGSPSKIGDGHLIIKFNLRPDSLLLKFSCKVDSQNFEIWACDLPTHVHEPWNDLGNVSITYV